MFERRVQNMSYKKHRSEEPPVVNSDETIAAFLNGLQWQKTKYGEDFLKTDFNNRAEMFEEDARLVKKFRSSPIELAERLNTKILQAVLRLKKGPMRVGEFEYRVGVFAGDDYIYRDKSKA